MTDRESRVLQLRFGLEDGRSRTLEEVGREVWGSPASGYARLRPRPCVSSGIPPVPASSGTSWNSPPLPQEHDGDTGDSIRDRDIPESYDSPILRRIEDQIRDMVGGLTERESRFLQLRFGLGDGRRRTLEEAAGELGIVPEQAQEIEAGAMQKLRDYNRPRYLGVALLVA